MILLLLTVMYINTYKITYFFSEVRVYAPTDYTYVDDDSFDDLSKILMQPDGKVYVILKELKS